MSVVEYVVSLKAVNSNHGVVKNKLKNLGCLQFKVDLSTIEVGACFPPYLGQVP